MTTYEQTLLESLAARGMTVDRNGDLARLPGYGGEQHVSDEEIRIFNARRAAPSLRTDLEWRWVASLADIVRVLVTEGEKAPWPWVSMFWIRLLGVFVDIRPHFVQTFKAAGVDPMTHAATPTSTLEWAIDTFRAIEALRAALTEDELVYLDYCRHAEGHPKQHAYAPSITSDGKIKEARGLAVLEGRVFAIADLQAAIARVESTHHDPRLAAVALATRLADPIAVLYNLMKRGHGK